MYVEFVPLAAAKHGVTANDIEMSLNSVAVGVRAASHSVEQDKDKDKRSSPIPIPMLPFPPPHNPEVHPNPRGGGGGNKARSNITRRDRGATRSQNSKRSVDISRQPIALGQRGTQLERRLAYYSDSSEEGGQRDTGLNYSDDDDDGDISLGGS